MKEFESKLELFKLHQREAAKMLKSLIWLKLIYLLKYKTKETIRFTLVVICVFAMFKSEFNRKVFAGFADSQKTFHYFPQVIYKPEKDHDSFLDDLAMFESSGRYDIVKTAGDYWGRYQIGPIARKELGIDKISQSEFLSNERLQDGLVTALLLRNKKYLKNAIGEYEGKMVRGIYITQSGLLAGAHLRGVSSVVKFLESEGKIDEKDGNGVPVSKYIKYFGNYNLNM